MYVFIYAKKDRTNRNVMVDNLEFVNDDIIATIINGISRAWQIDTSEIAWYLSK